MRPTKAATNILAVPFALLIGLLSPISLRSQDEAAVASFDSLIKAEKFTEARPALEKYAATHPKSWEAFYQLGYVEFRLHDFRGSLANLCKSLVLNANFAEAHKILAYDLNIIGRQDLALGELERAINLNPLSAESHYEMGRIYYEQGSYLKAIDHLEKAKSLSPNYLRVYHNLGLAYSAVGDSPKAVANFEKALELNAQQNKPSAWPFIDYATYFNLQGDFARARDLLLKAIQIDNTWDEEYNELFKAYRALGQPDNAINALKRAIVLNPSKAEYHYALAQLYTNVHDTKQAKEQLAEYERDKTSGPK